MSNSVKRAAERLRLDDELKNWYRKVYDLRLLLAGDPSTVYPSIASSEPDDSTTPQNGTRVEDMTDVVVMRYKEGRSNKIQQAVKTLMQQVAYSEPDIEFEDAETEFAQVMAAYAKKRLGSGLEGCNMVRHSRLALVDYMCGGMGWLKSCLVDDAPQVRYADTLDVRYDRTCRVPEEMEWQSVAYRLPVWKWARFFGEGPFDEELKGGKGENTVVELEYYYDREGNHFVFRRNGKDEVDETPVYAAKDAPYVFTDSRGKKRPFLPLTPMHFMLLPSVRMPIGLVEMMLPSQIALWRVEDNIDAILKRGQSFWKLRGGFADEKQKARFMRGDMGVLVELEATAQLEWVPAGEVNQTTLAWQQYHDRELTSHGGANPYAGGNRVEGIEYASEVNAIKDAAGLTAGWIARDYNQILRPAIQKFLAVGAEYETGPFSLRIGSRLLEFDENEPISEFILPDADVSIRDDSTAYAPRSQKIQEALSDLQTALSVAQAFPKAPGKAYERYLRARGEQDVAGWLESLPAAPMEAEEDALSATV